MVTPIQMKIQRPRVAEVRRRCRRWFTGSRDARTLIRQFLQYLLVTFDAISRLLSVSDKFLPLFNEF